MGLLLPTEELRYIIQSLSTLAEQESNGDTAQTYWNAIEQLRQRTALSQPPSVYRPLSDFRTPEALTFRASTKAIFASLLTTGTAVSLLFYGLPPRISLAALDALFFHHSLC